MALPVDQQADVLDKVTSLAALFSTCVEAFGLIHASKAYDRPQKLALAKLGIEQGRLLVFGDVVGISSPPATIATHMIPSNPGPMKPDPNEPINFGVRDPRLDDANIRPIVEATLNEITDRPAALTRDEMMERYGLRPGKQSAVFEPALDHNRLAAFREKYGILQDLYGQNIRPRRGMSMATQHWDITDITKFDLFVKMVRQQVDTLIEVLDAKEQVDRGMNIDIRAMGWHPDVTAPLVRRDWEKLKVIADSSRDDYPQYVKSTEVALEFLNKTYREAYRPYDPAHMTSTKKAVPAPKINTAVTTMPPTPTPADVKSAKKSKRPSWLRAFSAIGRDTKPGPKTSTSAGVARSKSVNGTATTDPAAPVASSSPPASPLLATERSKSLPSPVPEPSTHVPLSPTTTTNEATREQYRQDSVQTSPVVGVHHGGGGLENSFENAMAKVDTYNSMIERHDRYPGMGRVETKDMRTVAHGWHN